MTPTEFTADIAGLKISFEKACTRILKIAGNEIVRMTKENFLNEGFFGAHWQEVKRRQPRNIIVKTKKGRKKKTIPCAKGAAGKRRILTGATGDLGRSIKYEITGKTLIIYSDTIYAKIHNEGGYTGRGHKTRVPQGRRENWLSYPHIRRPQEKTRKVCSNRSVGAIV